MHNDAVMLNCLMTRKLRKVDEECGCYLKCGVSIKVDSSLSPKIYHYCKSHRIRHSILMYYSITNLLMNNCVKTTLHGGNSPII